jgi:hypothetical protein
MMDKCIQDGFSNTTLYSTLFPDDEEEQVEKEVPENFFLTYGNF